MSNIIKQRVQYGSLSYMVLTYSRFKSRQGDGSFTAKEYQHFRFASVKPSYLQRAINSLVRQGHLRKTHNNGYVITVVGSSCLDELSIAYTNSLWARGKKNRSSKALEEIKDIHSEDF